MSKKTDNANPAAKLDLRRHFLRKYHSTPDAAPDVLDCCQATGFLWRTLGREFPLVGNWGIDLNPRKGRLKIDSVRILGQNGWTQNIVYVDTYGSPWKHWLALIAHLPAHPVTVFLTIGNVRMGGGGSLPGAVRDRLGLRFPRAKLSPVFTSSILRIGVPAMLAAPLELGHQVIECREAPPGPNARYIGIHLIPAGFPEYQYP